MKPIPQKYTVGSDWLAGSVYCDFLNHLQKRPASHLSSMHSSCNVNNGVFNIAYHFELDCGPENISEVDRAEPEKEIEREREREM